MRFSLPILLIATAGLSATESKIALQRIWKDTTIERPVAVVIPPDGSGRRFLVQQRGRILIMPQGDNGAATEFLNLSGLGMESEDGKFEEGLLGLAFHPDFAKNGLFYLAHSLQNPKRSVVSEWKVRAENPSKADRNSERVLLEVPQPYWNHNSGNLLFGPDGYLYLAFGDGGKGGDFRRLAQNLFLLNGKILRIDVNSRAWHSAYGIPPDNPLVKEAGVRPEIWAWGLRNPWGLSFDTKGRLWCADVGQNQREEIDIIQKGGNYGWSFREGTLAFPAGAKEPDVDPKKLIPPIFEYDRTTGLSITGGFVYEGVALPSLKGKYIYGDWGYGRFSALTGLSVSNETIYESPENDPAREQDLESKPRIQPTCICPDNDGEILVLDWHGGAYRMIPVAR